MSRQTELRVARDGLPYTLAQFQNYYSPSVAWGEWQDAAPFASGASQPAVDAMRSSADLRVALDGQPAVEAHGASGAVQPAVQQPTPQPPPQPHHDHTCRPSNQNIYCMHSEAYHTD